MATPTFTAGEIVTAAKMNQLAGVAEGQDLHYVQGVRSATNQSVASGTNTVIIFPSQTDPESIFDGTTVTIGSAGLYVVDLTILWSATFGLTTTRHLYLDISGSLWVQNYQDVDVRTQQCSGARLLEVGDTITARVVQSSGSTRNVSDAVLTVAQIRPV